MGSPPTCRPQIAFCREGLKVHNADAVEWLHWYRSSGAPAFDVAFVDAFDGQNDVPLPFQTAGALLYWLIVINLPALSCSAETPSPDREREIILCSCMEILQTSPPYTLLHMKCWDCNQECPS